MVCAFRRLHVRGSCPGLFDHVTQLLRVFQHRTRLEHIVIEWLSVVIGPEQRRLHDLQKTLFTDVSVRIMNEYAWVNVAAEIRYRQRLYCSI